MKHIVLILMIVANYLNSNNQCHNIFIVMKMKVNIAIKVVDQSTFII